jgi:hypothetical protein
MPNRTSTASATKKMSSAPWPPLPPVWVAPEFGAGAFGGSGGNGSGTFDGAGRWERPPPDVELSTDERTLDRATLRAELELLDQLALVLARTSRRRILACRTIVVFARIVVLCRGADASRSCRTGLPSPGSPKVPDGNTGRTIDGVGAWPVAIAGTSTGAAETGARTSTGSGAGGSETAGWLGGAGAPPAVGKTGAGA